MEALKILKEVIPVLGCENTSKILKAVSPILISARLDVRLSVCDLFDALAESDSSLRSTVIVFILFSSLESLKLGFFF